MLGKTMCVTAAAAAALLFSACSSVEFGTNLNGEKLATDNSLESVGHVNGEIWGIYLVNLPIFTGSSMNPGKIAVFTDTVTVHNAVSMTTRQAREKTAGRYVIDITSTRANAWMAPFLIFWYREVQVSGNILK